MGYIDQEKQKEYQRKWYQRNKEITRIRSQKQRNKGKRWLQEYKAKRKCEMCGEDCWQCLEFHHKNPNNKIQEVSIMVNFKFSMEKVLKEINKCALVCANCHRKIHAGIICLDND